MTEIEFLTYACKGNMAAVDFLGCMGEITQTYDDLYDRDRDVSKEQIVRLLWLTMIGLPRNSFYRRFKDYFDPLLTHIYMDWRDANDLEKGSENDQSVAYVLRDTADSLIAHCADLIGGVEWEHKIAKESRQRTFGGETLAQYREKLT